MSNSISTDHLPAAPASYDDPPTRMPARQPTGDSWSRTFEHALGASFDRWFQAPTERGDAMPDAARPTFAAPTLSQPAALMFGHANGSRSSTASSRVATSVTASRDAPTSSNDAASPAAAGASREVAMPQGTTPMSVRQSASQALVATLGNLIGPIPVVAVEAPSQAVPAATTSSFSTIADGARDATGVDDADDAEPMQAHEPDPARDAGAADERDPLRVHAEWSDAGVRVWLGADAEGLAAVDAITRQLQHWLGAQGTRLLGVVCNGEEVWSPGPDGDAAVSFSTAADTVLEHPRAATDARTASYLPNSL